jgi:hypothetical protein
MIRLEPERQPPPPKIYAPPTKGRWRPRRGLRVDDLQYAKGN